MTGLAAGLVLFGLVFDPADRLIWNRTASAPTGLYWLSDAPFTHGRWVVVSSQSMQATWAQQHGFVGEDWPLLKQIAGVTGDEICRTERDILINNEVAAQALTVDSSGRNLPVWDGCIRLQSDEVFLLTPHPASLDGRYFGPTNQSDLDGVAIPLFRVRA
ncbi:S26 family signal peptidase [Hyphomonas pacifica]|nr:S26 family signal peptidase [Hyphomonas pacifica]